DRRVVSAAAIDQEVGGGHGNDQLAAKDFRYLRPVGMQDESARLVGAFFQIPQRALAGGLLIFTESLEGRAQIGAAALERLVFVQAERLEIQGIDRTNARREIENRHAHEIADERANQNSRRIGPQLLLRGLHRQARPDGNPQHRLLDRASAVLYRGRRGGNVLSDRGRALVPRAGAEREDAVQVGLENVTAVRPVYQQRQRGSRFHFQVGQGFLQSLGN